MEEKKETKLELERALSLHDTAFAALGFKPKTPSSDRHVGPLEDLPMAKRIEHTLLKIDGTDEDVTTLCEAAMTEGFRSVCCLPRDVSTCCELLDGSDVLVVTVLNFPLAGSPLETMEFECKKAVENGAHEVDFVVDVRSLKKDDLEMARRHASSVVKAAGGRTVKAILETGTLSPEQLVRGMAAVEAAGVTYAKTSTGFGPRGASVTDIELMRAVCGDRLGIKASGGIKDRAWAEELVKAGADLIGTSSGTDCI